MIEGVEIIKHTRHGEDRGFFQELLRVNEIEKFGQWSISWMYQDVIKAWHIHQIQTDYFYVPVGVLKVVLWDRREDSKTHNQVDEFVMDNGRNNFVLKIPPGVAHGVKVLQGPAMLMYITSEVYNPDDEGRIHYDCHFVHGDGSIGSQVYDWLGGPSIK